MNTTNEYKKRLLEKKIFMNDNHLTPVNLYEVVRRLVVNECGFKMNDIIKIEIKKDSSDLSSSLYYLVMYLKNDSICSFVDNTVILKIVNNKIYFFG